MVNKRRGNDFTCASLSLLIILLSEYYYVPIRKINLCCWNLDLKWQRCWECRTQWSQRSRPVVLKLLKLKFRQYPEMHTNRMLYIPLYNIIIIFDTVVTQRQHFKHENDEIISVAILRLSQHHQVFCAARLHTSTVRNLKIAHSERSYYLLLLHSHSDVSYDFVVE